MTEDWKWFLGLLVTMAVAFGGVMIAAFRNVYQKMSKGDNALHKRIDDVKDEYVRQDHLQTHIDHLGKRLDDMRDESRNRHAELKELVKDALK